MGEVYAVDMPSHRHLLVQGPSSKRPGAEPVLYNVKCCDNLKESLL
jgi:hypothetical protein